MQVPALPAREAQAAAPGGPGRLEPASTVLYCMLVLRDPAHTVTVVKGADGAGIATITLTHCT
jgi:hypothetical protein